jgi:Asp-tRNA(Asn)/Glu-tRNA(Gln) amidotransferase A subunit family amidase
MQGKGEAPCGLMVLAPHGYDRALFGVAAALEKRLEQVRN